MRSLLAARALLAILALSLAACGGGVDVGLSFGNAPLPPPVFRPIEPGAPVVRGDIAVDAGNWINFRRQQSGLPALTFSNALDFAAEGHALYQQRNQVLTHTQIPGAPGFTGVTEADRLADAGYLFTRFPNLFDEVITAVEDGDGIDVAETLIAGIYHRYVLFEPVFVDLGTGAAVDSDGTIFFTATLAANGYGGGVGIGNAALYPFPGQQRVPAVFFSDTELPDPVAGANAVGYPVSIHADVDATLVVSSFTIRPRSGALLPVRLLTRATDAATPPSAAAIIPLAVLVPGTTYDVEFTGLIDNLPVSTAWSFTTS